MMKGGFNAGNMQNIMRQAQKMQSQLQEQTEKAEKQLAETILSASSGGGVVTVEITGLKKLVSVVIKPEVVDSDDVEMLQDLVMSAVNEAIEKANELEEELKPNIPGGLF